MEIDGWPSNQVILNTKYFWKHQKSLTFRLKPVSIAYYLILVLKYSLYMHMRAGSFMTKHLPLWDNKT